MKVEKKETEEEPAIRVYEDLTSYFGLGDMLMNSATTLPTGSSQFLVSLFLGLFFFFLLLLGALLFLWYDKDLSITWINFLVRMCSGSR